MPSTTPISRAATVAALQNNMPLLCDLGRHRPEPVARWNNGYYFTRCARCGEDLVRTAYGRWHVPRGYRVVWQAQPPANAVSAALVQERAGPAPAGATELPIQEVLRHLQNGDSSAEAADAPVAEEPGGDRPPDADEPAAGGTGGERDSPGVSAHAIKDELISRAVPAPRIPDFMEEATGVSAWESPSRAYLLRQARADRDRDADFGQEADRGPGPLTRLRAHVAGLFERDRGEDLPEPIDEEGASARVSQNMRLALIAVVPIMLLLLALVLWTGREDGGFAGANDSAARDAEAGPGSGQPAFVTASLLNCRNAPAREAESVKVLMRGDPVRLLARDGEWVSLVHESGQCWALVRYFSVEQPI